MTKLRAALISLGSKSSQMTLKAMMNYFDEVDDINIKTVEVNLGEKGEVLYEGKTLKRYDCIYAKGSFRFSPLLRAVTSILGPTTYMPVNAEAFTSGHDKLLTQLDLQRLNTPMPKTYFSSTVEAAKKLLETLNFPIIMKFPQGTQGKGVLVADSYSSAISMLDALSSLRQPFILQEYVETGGADIRAFVVGENVVAAMKRQSKGSDVRANMHQGGEGEKIILDSKTKRIAVAAAKGVGAEICAVDILESVKGPVVIEINLSPGLQGITSVTGVDVADKIAKYLYKKTAERHTAGSDIGARQILKPIEVEREQQVISNLDFRGERILLPELVTKMAKFDPADEFNLKINAGKVIIEKM